MDIAKIIVHPGVFHADDVCVVAWLRITGITAPVERRVPTAEELEDPTILVADVGGQYDPMLSNYDHHQRGGAGSRWDTDIPFAAFGLVFGHWHPKNTAVETRFHDRVVVAVDAADCGWGTLEGTRPNLGFSACVAGFNPGPTATPAERMTAFEKAVAFAQQVLENELRSAEAHVAAASAVAEAHTADAGRVLILEEFVPWDEHVFNRVDQEKLLYVVFPSARGGWMLQQVAKEPGSFEGRKPLPTAWRGLRGAELATLTGLSKSGDATFCHVSGFCGGAETREDALVLAALAVEASEMAQASAD